MRATHLLDSLLRGQCQEIHKMRMKALFKSVEALLRGRKLSVTGLGRAMGSDAKVKHNIKCADRLIGNPQLNQQINGVRTYFSNIRAQKGKRGR